MHKRNQSRKTYELWNRMEYKKEAIAAKKPNVLSILYEMRRLVGAMRIKLL
jgi:hypothetical protein